MKTLCTLVVLSALALGQNPYVKVTAHNGTVLLKNTSGQPIVLIVGNITLNGKTLPHPDGTISQYHHEFFFDEGGFAAGDSMDFETKSAIEPHGWDYSIVPTFIQFDDGSTWGTKDARAESVIASRATKLAYLRTLANSAGNSATFTSALNHQTANAEEKEVQRRLQDWTNVYGLGTSGTIDRVKKLLAAGTARQNSGKF